MNRLIALAIPPGDLFVEQLLSAWDRGDAVLPIDLRLPPSAQERLVETMKPAIIVDEHANANTLSKSSPVEDDDALVIATSGTTGEPKGVVLTHEAIKASAKITSSYLQVNKDDSWLCCLPVAHIGGLSVITRALLTDTPFKILPRFDAEAVQNSACTLVSLVSTAMQRIDVSKFRAIVLGAGNLPPALPDNVFPTYGMTETASGIYYRETPLEGVELRVNEGQIWIKSPTLLRCYRDGTNPKIDGWLPSGDGGELDANGKLTVHGRIGEMINTGGEKVWPQAVEKALKAHSNVNEALVYPEPDSEWGQRVVAKIEVCRSDDVPTRDELLEFLKSELPSFSIPKEFIVVDKLERTPLGKVKRSS